MSKDNKEEIITVKITKKDKEYVVDALSRLMKEYLKSIDDICNTASIDKYTIESELFAIDESLNKMNEIRYLFSKFDRQEGI